MDDRKVQTGESFAVYKGVTMPVRKRGNGYQIDEQHQGLRMRRQVNGVNKTQAREIARDLRNRMVTGELFNQKPDTHFKDFCEIYRFDILRRAFDRGIPDAFGHTLSG